MVCSGIAGVFIAKGEVAGMVTKQVGSHQAIEGVNFAWYTISSQPLLTHSDRPGHLKNIKTSHPHAQWFS